MDLNDLPLDRLTEQKEKRRRGGAVRSVDNSIVGTYSVSSSSRTNNVASNVDAGKGIGLQAPRRARDRAGSSVRPAPIVIHQDDTEGGPSSFANSGLQYLM